MQFDEFAKQHIPQISKTLEQELEKWSKHVSNTHPFLVKLNKEFEESLSGGKVLRGVFVLLGYKLVTEQIPEELYKIAASYEIVHTSLLIHDDIMDQSLLRRGKPSLYKALGGNHYGISQAISLGDMGYFLSYKLINDSKFDPKIKEKALALYSQTLLDTVLGQMLDIELPQKKQRTEQDVVTIYKTKTAQYSISAPLVLGAIFAGADDKTLRFVKEFGEYLGIAFQIIDDMLSIFGQQEVTGKSGITDVRDGKNTLLITYAMKHADEEQKNFLQIWYGNPKISEKEFLEMKHIFGTSGAKEYATKQAEINTEKAKEKIKEITNSQEKQKLLTSLCDFLLNRQK